METMTLLLGLAFAINKTSSVIKAITNGEYRTVLTQVIVWVVGFVGLLLAAQANVMQALVVPGADRALGDLNLASVGVLAWILGSSGSFLYDIKKAVDNGDTASETPLATKATNTP